MISTTTEEQEIRTLYGTTGYRKQWQETSGQTAHGPTGDGGGGSIPVWQFPVVVILVLILIASAVGILIVCRRKWKRGKKTMPENHAESEETPESVRSFESSPDAVKPTTDAVKPTIDATKPPDADAMDVNGGTKNTACTARSFGTRFLMTRAQCSYSMNKNDRTSFLQMSLHIFLNVVGRRNFEVKGLPRIGTDHLPIKTEVGSLTV